MGCSTSYLVPRALFHVTSVNLVMNRVVPLSSGIGFSLGWNEYRCPGGQYLAYKCDQAENTGGSTV